MVFHLFLAKTHRGLWGPAMLLAGLLVGCGGQAAKTKSPLEMVLEASRPAPEAGVGAFPGQSLQERAAAEEIPEEVIDALADILLESEQEASHPLPFYFLPQTERGMVDWVAAIELGVIAPMDHLDPTKEKFPPMDFNVIFKVKGDLPDVVYPHYPHTLWLDCKNCHPGIFVMQAGVNNVTMDAITKGKFCGQCHGKVAFPLYECNRCHSKPKPGKSLIIPRGLG